MKYKDYYKTLGVERTASKDEIKKAYRKLAKKHHPDANQGNKVSEEKFKEASEAYEVLSDDAKKSKYDKFGNTNQFSGDSSFDPSQFGGYSGHSSSQSGFSDFFEFIFGGGDPFGGYKSTRTRQRPVARKGRDTHAVIDISIEDAYLGGDKRISLSDETGSTKTISFKIPKRIKDGGKVRIKGQGENGINGGANGDIILTVKIKDGKDTFLEDDNIVSRLKVSPWEALLGAEVSVNLFDGRHTIKIPKNIQTGGRLRFADKGLGSKDMFLEIMIVNPKSPTDEEIKQYEKLKEISHFDPRQVK